MKVRPHSRALELAITVRERLSAALGQPVRVILYGSQARGDATDDSDIDLFVIVPKLDARMRALISDIAWEVSFEAEELISVIPAEEGELEILSASPFYRAVQEEGIAV